MYIDILGSSSSGNGYIINTGYGSLIIECGIQLKYAEKYLGYDFDKVSGVIVTHEHGDHAKYINEYINHFKVYATKGTLDKCDIMGHYNSNVIEYMKLYHIGCFKVMPFITQHDAEQPCGFVIKLPTGDNMVFATDTNSLRFSFGNISYWFIECNYDNDILKKNVCNGIINEYLACRIKKSHLSLGECIKMLSINNMEKAKIITLIHLSDKNSDKSLFAEKIAKITGKSVIIAKKGIRIELL